MPVIVIEDDKRLVYERKSKVIACRDVNLRISRPMQPTERNFARRMDLTSLQLFVAVCEMGSIGKAAEREFMAASAISKRLSDLEATLDTQLLYRHTRGVGLTPAGESLLHHARSVLFSLEKMQGELSEYADGAMCAYTPAFRPRSSFYRRTWERLFVSTQKSKLTLKST